MIYKAQFETKRSRVDFDECDIRFSVGLSKEDFDHLRTNLLEESEYIKPYLHMLDKNAEIDQAMLFTCDNEKYGLIVIPSDIGYARYTAFVPDARRMPAHMQYSSLDKYDEEMTRIVGLYTQKALEDQEDGEYNLDLDEVYNEFKFREFNQNLFLDMLRDRPEFDDINFYDGVYTVKIAKDYLSDDEYYRLYQDDIDIMEAKHILWMHDAGGEQADFRGCEMDGIHFNGKNFAGAIFDDSIITNCDFENALLMSASFNESEINRCSFKNATAEEVTAKNASFIDSDFTQADFLDSKFNGTCFNNCNFDCITIEGSCIKDVEFQETRPEQDELYMCYEELPESEQNQNINI
ncbi:pentapeptide repeat-containing protein [Ruminococcus sp.]|uniref:pentapeptide repeat-containing protein n=1 Tax=Ruminococcus sp. TaxID=41978 RepID=UPI00388E90D9